jgi:tetratricopeptide (TPR) repeat protein
MKHKSTYPSGLTRGQIDAYRSGSESERRRTEDDLKGSFEQDALDGWEESGLKTTVMGRLDKRFRFTSSAPYIIGSTILIGAGIAAAVLFTNDEPAKASAQTVNLQIEQTDAVIAQSIDTLHELPASEQIRIAVVKATQQEIKDQPADVPMTNIDELPVVILEPLKPEPEPRIEKAPTQKTAKEIYLHDLKLVDYRQYRSKPEIEIEKIILTGTSANYETNEQMEVEPTIQTAAVPYITYIDKTMDYVNRGKWKQSLQRLQEVLATYPDDVNGHFYAGLCCYNLQQYDEAKQHFATCLQLTYNNFNEEATWYLAQSFLANGEKTSAKELLGSIRDQKGYYSKQAEKLLKGIR